MSSVADFKPVPGFAEAKEAQAQRDAEYIRSWKRSKTFERWVSEAFDASLKEILRVAQGRRNTKARLAKGFRR